MGEAFKALADLLEVVLPMINLALVGVDVKADLIKLEPEIRNEMAWTGDTGYLIYVPVGKHPGTGHLIYGGVRPKGGGKSPDSILASSIGRSTLEKPLPAYLSDDHTFFVWYNAKDDRWSITPPEFVDDLKLRAIALKNDSLLLQSIEENRKNEIFAHAVEVLKDRVKNSHIKKIIIESAQRLAGYRQKASEIEAKISKALEKAKKAADFQQRLNVFKNIVSAGQLAAQADELIPDAGIDANDDVLTMERKTREYKVEQDGYILRYKEDIELQKRLTNEEAEKLRPLLKENGAPGVVTGWTL